ncbi:MAG: TRC40/GET3/ArsA family transport-energizing ATPase [Thermoprotei archaeon]
MRIIMFMGKGGTGKTSSALATGILCADKGHRTLVISTDGGHSIPDALEMPVGSEPTRVTERLYAMELDARSEVEKNWGSIRDYMNALFATRLDESLAAELSQMPGIEELLGVLKIEEFRNQWDVMVLDSAPTGQALRFLMVPEVMGRFGLELIKLQRTATKLLKPMQPVLPIPIPDESVYEQAEGMIKKLKLAGDIMRDPDVSSIRLVTNPEKMAVLQTQRNFTFMSLFGFNVDMVILNRFFPDNVGDYFSRWKQIQNDYTRAVESSFYPIPLRKVKYFQNEVVGLENLREMGIEIYGEEDPSSVFHKGKPFEVTKEEGYYVLKLQIPFIAKGDVKLSQDGDMLSISVRSSVSVYEREIALPKVLEGKEAVGAKLDEKASSLFIRFKRKGSLQGGSQRRKSTYNHFLRNQMDEKGSDRSSVDDPLFSLLRTMVEPLGVLALCPLVALAISHRDNPHVMAARREILLALKDEIERELGEGGGAPPKRKEIRLE